MNEFQAVTGEYKRRFIDDILEGMEHLIDNNQLSELNKSLYYNTNNLNFADNPENHDLNWEKTNEILIKEFIKSKKTKGLSKQTIRLYTYTLRGLEEWTVKSFLELTSEDLKDYFIFYQEQRNCCKTTLNNTRRNLSSFFRFLTDEEKILVNPMLRIPAIKEPKKIKKAFTYDEIEKMRWFLNRNTFLKNKEVSIRTIRTQAMFELFLSSGIRVGELVSLKIDNIDFDECKAIVHGKGDKERVIYFSEKAKNYMLQYLGLRTDDRSNMFTQHAKGCYSHLSIHAVDDVFKRMGDYLDIDVHPHKFRRTFCSYMIKKGMPIDQVQKLMGHESIETTLRYLDMDDETIAMTHKKYTNF